MEPAQITFDRLPEAVGTLLHKVEHLEQMMSAGTVNVQPLDYEAPMNVEEAAKFLKLSVKSVRVMAASGELPHSKPAKHLLFFRSELLAWVEGARRKTNGQIAADVEQRLTESAA